MQLFKHFRRLNEKVIINYSITNSGDGAEATAKRFFDNVSDAAAGILNVIYKSKDGFNRVSDLTKLINSVQYAGCDGPTVLEGFQVDNNKIRTETEHTDGFNHLHIQARTMNPRLVVGRLPNML